MRAVEHIELHLDFGQPIPELRLLRWKRVLINLVIDPQIEQPILLSDDQRFLPLQLAPLSACFLLSIGSLRAVRK